MNIMERYIAKITFIAILIIYAGLMLLFSFMNILRASYWVGKGDFQTIDSFYFAFLSVPYTTYQIFPFCVLLGTLVGLNYLNTHNEITAIRSSGFSNVNIIYSIIKLCLPLSIMIFLLGEMVIPNSERALSEFKQQKMNSTLKVNLKNDVWIKDKQHVYHIKTIHSDKSLSKITIYEFENTSQKLKQIIYANQATVNDNEWQLNKVLYTLISDQKISTKRTKQILWHTDISLEFIDIISSHINSLSAFDLYLYAEHLNNNGLDNSAYLLNFWQKIAAPFSLFAMLVIAFPFSTTHNRSNNMGTFLMIGILIGISYTVLNKISAEFGLLYQLPPFLSAFTFTILTLASAFFMIKKLK
ncbi:MAG: LPS export ABC transporter permease LptG [Gammaproteobacteria bacterium]|nr:LPS export ABC transporter permease LptG [Gammaproteobacteria bacterium]